MITIPTNNINIQFDHSIQNLISSIHFQHTITFTSTNIHVSEVHCRSAFEPGGSSLPYYYTPPVCVPDVLGALPVWRLSTYKKNNEAFDWVKRLRTKTSVLAPGLFTPRPASVPDIEIMYKTVTSRGTQVELIFFPKVDTFTEVFCSISNESLMW